MNTNGTVVIIEDDKDDQDLLEAVFKDLNIENKVVFFINGEDAYTYLVETSEQPFLILSDINMPKLNGLDLRDKVRNNEELKLKCIPYLFFTTSNEQKMVVAAYSKSVQGFFVKPSTYDHLKQVIHNIFEYWKMCHSPNF